MKESDTPLGKAYAKAKGTPPSPTPKGAGGDNEDVTARRYKTIGSQVPGDKNNEYKMIVTYDNVSNGFKIKVEHNKTKKIIFEEPFAQIQSGQGKAPITAAIGRAITSLSRNKLISTIDKDDVQALYDNVLESIKLSDEPEGTPPPPTTPKSAYDA